MLKTIIISVLISVALSSLTTIFAMHIMSNFFTRFLAQTENRFDQKLGIYKKLKKNSANK